MFLFVHSSVYLTPALSPYISCAVHELKDVVVGLFLLSSGVSLSRTSDFVSINDDTSVPFLEE